MYVCKHMFLVLTTKVSRRWSLYIIRLIKEHIKIFISVDPLYFCVCLFARFPKSESQFINAVLEEQSTNAACELAEKKAHTIRDSHLSSNVQELR